MRGSHLTPLAAALLLALTPGEASALWWGIKTGDDFLSEVDGRPVLTPLPPEKAAVDWDVGFRDPARIDVRQGKRWRWCLVYPLDGGDPAVTLAPPPDSAEPPRWVVKRVKGGYTVQAADGKFKGWYLDAGDEWKDKKSKATGRSLKLTKEPKKPLVFSIYEIAG